MNKLAETSPERADLLVELGCEELPPKALDAIREAFFRAVHSGLESSNISFDSGGSRSYSSPIDSCPDRSGSHSEHSL